MAAATPGDEFVEGWMVAAVLGEGAYGEVRLLVHARSGSAVALKVVRSEGEGDEAGAREARLHGALRHAHVLRCLGARAHGRLHYLFLEYAAGGELFERIAPDAGTGERAARRYWRQLLAGLGYLHARGVAHRDIKPENLLLDAADNVKISDFGMATLFRHGGRERLLSRVCGTVPYAAPEVLSAAQRPYRAAPADLWAAALVLTAMLTGELPWRRASPDDARFAAWARGARGGPWRRVPAAALRLLRAALHPLAPRRPALAAQLHHHWAAPAPGGGDGGRQAATWRSQPPPGDTGAGAELSRADMDAIVSSSQPAAAADLLLAGARGPLVRRMSRVWLRVEPARALAALGGELRARGLPHRRLQPHLLAVECGAELHVRAHAYRARDGAVLEFRRVRGCGLQFTRHFLELRAALAHLEAPPPQPDLGAPRPRVM